MAFTDKISTAATILTSDLAYHDEGIDDTDITQAQQRYGEERAKRLRDEGYKQYVEPSLTDEYRHFQDDPWVDPAAIRDIEAILPDNYSRFTILGGGFAGLQYAINLIEAGFKPEEICIVDTAGGLGGTWYWNRYPGLMCDIESYIYLPRLEETNYVPRHRYSYGDEIREYVNLLAKKWNVLDRAVLRTKAEHLEWDEPNKQWKVELLQDITGKPAHRLHINSQFVVVASGPLNWPKLPALPGMLSYTGNVFHSSRWNYDLTGGSQADPQLTKLKDKRVAIVGTGATAVQIVPELARWAKHLYVVQRTPAAIDTRDQRKTDEVWFRNEVANRPGWQRERIRNFHEHFTIDKPPSANLVADQWTEARALVARAGNPDGPQSMDQIPAYIQKLHAIDLPRQNRVRDRAKQTVKDPQTAASLQAWYPTWCKRPCFHDEYLPAFNQDNVTLLDTNGKGLEGFTENAITANGQSYPVDMVVLATGFRAPFLGSPAEKGNMVVLGRDGVSMSEAWARDGPTTLRGVIDHHFPNMFLAGPWQAGLSPNNTFTTDMLAKHTAYIIAESNRRADGKPCVISATKSGVDDWANQVISTAPAMATMAGCTPGYSNLEGEVDRLPPEAQMTVARSGLWGWGFEDFIERWDKWRDDGDMTGIEVQI